MEIRRRRQLQLWTLGVWLVLGASAAAAQSPADSVVEQLRDQGYVQFEVSRTLLGRIRVVALAPDGGWREIVLNRGTGEILRDYFEAADGSGAPMVLDRPDDDPDISRPAASGERGDSGASAGNGTQGNSPSAQPDDRPSGQPNDRPGGSERGQEAAGARAGNAP